MVRRHVRDAGELRAPLDKLELRVRQLDYDPGLRLDLLDEPEQADADVAADDVVQLSRFEHRAGECSGCGLAGGAGDAGDRGGTTFEEELGHRGDRHVGAPRSAEGREIGRDGLGDEHGVGVLGVLDPVFAEREPWLTAGDRCERIDELFRGPCVGHGDLSPFGRQVTYEVDSLDAEANNSHQSPLQVRYTGHSN